jgi:hypothetical protein
VTQASQPGALGGERLLVLGEDRDITAEAKQPAFAAGKGEGEPIGVLGCRLEPKRARWRRRRWAASAGATGSTCSATLMRPPKVKSGSKKPGATSVG